MILLFYLFHADKSIGEGDKILLISMEKFSIPLEQISNQELIDGVVQPSSGYSSLKMETAGCDKLQRCEEDENVMLSPLHTLFFQFPKRCDIM
jgi:hypothetical protein